MFEVRSLRTSVLNALFYIVENERLNEEFRLGDELSRAINFVYHARKGGCYSFWRQSSYLCPADRAV